MEAETRAGEDLCLGAFCNSTTPGRAEPGHHQSSFIPGLISGAESRLGFAFHLLFCVSLVCFHLEQFHNLSLFSMVLSFVRNAGQLFGRTSPSLGLTDVKSNYTFRPKILQNCCIM